MSDAMSDVAVCIWCGWADSASAPRDLVKGDDGMWRCSDEARCQRIMMIMLESDSFQVGED